MRCGSISLQDLRVSRASIELREFFLLPQSGARGVAKAVLQALSVMRSGQLSRVALDVRPLASTAIFTEVPADRGHFAEPYIVHVLRGLRSSLPQMVSDLLSGDISDAEGLPGVRGVVVIRV